MIRGVDMIQIRPVSDLRNKFSEVEKIVEGGEPVYLTKNGYGVMVVLSLEEYAKLTERTELRNEFQKLIQISKIQLHANPDAEQVIVVKSAKNRLRYCICTEANREAEEEAFVQELIQENDVELRNLVCMWNGNSLEIPSMHFRKRLLEICPENADTIMIFQGEYDSSFRTIQSTMP